jgi:Protein of unknown function (DUF3071)
MRELRFVGPGEGGNHVIVETSDGEEAFSLPIDEDLRNAVQGEAPTRREVRTGQPPVTPREIQVRVRAGESPQDIADEAGMSLDRVLLFAQQVLDERARIADEARRARARRNTADGQLVEFGAAVDARFSAHGIDASQIRWDSSRGADGHWVVTAGWRGGDVERMARWSFALGTRTLTPLDETAADLLSDRPIRPIVHAVPDLRASSPDTPTGPLPRPRPDGSFAPPSPIAPTPQPPATRPAAGEDEAAPPLPLHLSEPALPAPVRRTRSRHSAGVPAVPVEVPAAAAEETASADPGKTGKPKVPSWDDILLGVRRKRD